MATIELDLANYQDDNGEFSRQIINERIEGLNITFTELSDTTLHDGEILVSVPVEFTGSHTDLVELIARYEEDVDLRSDLIAEITDIHN